MILCWWKGREAREKEGRKGEMFWVDLAWEANQPG